MLNGEKRTSRDRDKFEDAEGNCNYSSHNRLNGVDPSNRCEAIISAKILSYSSVPRTLQRLNADTPAQQILLTGQSTR